MAEPLITPDKIEKLVLILRDKLHHGLPDLRQAYVGLLLNEVRVPPHEIRISSSKATSAGLSFVQEWRTRDDEDENWLIVI